MSSNQTRSDQLYLYAVRVVREAYVLARNPEEARKIAARDVDRNEPPSYEVLDGRTGLDGLDPYGTTGDAMFEDLYLVYHDIGVDITLRDAREKYPYGVHNG